MSRSSFSKAYEEIVKLEPMEVTFTIEDADLSKLSDMLKDINVKECPWFEVHDKHGNKAKYYREPCWIPCSERLPDERQEILATTTDNAWGDVVIIRTYYKEMHKSVIAWMPLPEPYMEVEE